MSFTPGLLFKALIAFLAAASEEERTRKWPALEKLLRDFLRPRIARKRNVPLSFIDDLIQEFMVELLTIVRDHDFSSLSHTQFGTQPYELSVQLILRALDRPLDRLSRSIKRQPISLSDQQVTIASPGLSSAQIALESLTDFELTDQEIKLLVGLLCQGHSFAEMSRQLGIPVSSLRQTYARAINRLRGL